MKKPSTPTTIIKKYYVLTKPGIIRGNLVNATAGFLLASSNHVDLILLGYVLLSTSLVVACGCVLNNILDRRLDAKMDRTKNRSLVSGETSVSAAVIYAAALGVVGSAIIILFINKLALVLGLFGLFMYVVVYGYFKRKSVHGTVIGSISGAIPPTVGYVAVANTLDIGALLVFLVVTFWQMPHFYAIAMYRSKEYAAAGIPVLPLARGVATTKRYILIYMMLFFAAVLALFAVGFTGWLYFAVMTTASLYWLRLAWMGFDVDDDDKWARQIFGVSLLVILAWCVSIGLDSALFG